MKKQPRQTLTAPMKSARFVWVAIFFVLWVVAIVARLGWLQVVQRDHFSRIANRQQQRTFEVAPRRGLLYDRNLRELAMTVLVDSVYAVPSELGSHRADDAALLASIVHTDDSDHFTSEAQILARLNASHVNAAGKNAAMNFAWVAHRVDAETAQRVRELNLKGIYLQKEFKRFYPNSDLAAQVLGYVGVEDNGLGGLEKKFDDEMHGTPGHMLTAVDAKHHVFGSDEQQPLPGENLVLSIDANIQYIAERALDAQVAKFGALHGTVVVQDPHTGQILALAVSPRFNPNETRHLDPTALSNLAVSDVYEPGSTFKLATYAAAIDGAGVEPTDIVDCQGGAMTMYGRTLHDDKADHFGRVTVQYALEHSSDVGAAKMALKLGADKFSAYLKGFGFGERTGIELPSETRGLLAPPHKWGATSILSISIGQEVAVTPVQLVAMVSTIANGGVYMPPRILLQSTDEMKGDPRLKPIAFHPSNELPSPLPEGAHRVLKELTAAKMRAMMQGVVVEGTGKAAALNGYSSGGKTGTANKIDPATHTYSHTKLVASFAGIAPVSNPAVSIAVVIDNPTIGSSFYGAAVSAPVFADVAQQVLEYLGVPHDMPLKSKKAMTALASADMHEDAPQENSGDLSALFAEVNSLPADDPLREPANAAAMQANAAADQAADAAAGHTPTAGRASRALQMLPDKVLAAFHAHGNTTSLMPETPAENKPLAAPKIPPAAEQRPNGAVIVDAGKRVAVPDFHGEGLREALQRATGAGLRLQPVGSGLAREQVPAAGATVPAGTQIVVRFSR